MSVASCCHCTPDPSCKVVFLAVMLCPKNDDSLGEAGHAAIIEARLLSALYLEFCEKFSLTSINHWNLLKPALFHHLIVRCHQPLPIIDNCSPSMCRRLFSSSAFGIWRLQSMGSFPKSVGNGYCTQYCSMSWSTIIHTYGPQCIALIYPSTGF